MRGSSWPGLLAIALLPVMAVVGLSTDAPSKLNVIVVLMDDLGWKDLGCTGSTFQETPNIDRLASRGVLPTLAEICGLKGMPPGDGRSLAPAVAGKTMDDRPFFMHYPHYGNWAAGGYPAVTMVADGWKLIRFFFDGPGQAHRYELYYLAEDVGEATDLSQREPERVAEMDRQIDEFLRDTGAVLPQRNPEYRGP